MESCKGLDGNYPGLFTRRDDGPNTDHFGNGGDWFYEHWGWFVWVDRLANGDTLKWDAVTEMNIVEFLNKCQFIKDKATVENR